jgi:hypothetical protein
MSIKEMVISVSTIVVLILGSSQVQIWPWSCCSKDAAGLTNTTLHKDQVLATETLPWH